MFLKNAIVQYTFNNFGIEKILGLEIIKDWENIIVAGGSVINAIIGDEEAIKNGDLDIFFCIPKPIDKKKSMATYNYAVTIIKKKMLQIHETISSTRKNIKYTFTKTGNIDLTFQDENDKSYRIQYVCGVIFDDAMSCINTFDLNNVKFAYDGQNIIYTPDAAQYLQDMTIRPIKTRHERPWAKTRLDKYLSRSYNKCQWLDFENLSKNQQEMIYARDQMFEQEYQSFSEFLNKQFEHPVEIFAFMKRPKRFNVWKFAQNFFGSHPSYELKYSSCTQISRAMTILGKNIVYENNEANLIKGVERSTVINSIMSLIGVDFKEAENLYARAFYTIEKNYKNCK